MPRPPGAPVVASSVMSPAPDNRTAGITGRSFATRRKGFDPDEVRAYLGQLAEVVDRLTTERDLARAEVADLRADAEAKPVVDEDQLTAALGEETARVLSSARKAAADIRERAEENVSRMLREAAESAAATRRDAEADAARLRDEAQTIRSEADEARRRAEEDARTLAEETRSAAETDAAATREAATEELARAGADAEAVRDEADADAARIRSEAEGVLAERTAEAEVAAEAIRADARTDADAVRADAEVDAEQIRAAAAADRDAAQAEGKEMVAEAQRVRERMLSDLARRRKAAKVQLEQLQAARDRLLETYDGVQRTIDDATAGLRRALPDARSAADAARMRAEDEPESSVEELEAQIAAAREADLPLVAPLDDDAPSVPGPDEPITEPTPVIDLTGEAPDGAEEADVVDDAPADEPPTDQTPVAEVEVEVEESESIEAPGEDETSRDGEEGEAGVDALFAQLRASQTDDAENPSTENTSIEKTDTVDADTAEATVDDATVDVTADLDDGAAGTDFDEDDPDADEALLTLLERRDGAVEPIEVRIARRLKRVLADEQGLVLDRIRRDGDRIELESVVSIDDQVEAYAAAARDDLLAAAEEGATFEGAALPSSTSVDPLAEELGRVLAGVVRPRVERCFEGIDDGADVSDRLRSVYREWKTDRLIETTRHIVLAAFGQGQVAVHPADALLRWVADPTGSACPDCEDDVLAGPVARGTTFPTGHVHPPAHPGCRCLVVSERVAASA